MEKEIDGYSMNRSDEYKILELEVIDIKYCKGSDG